MNETNTPPSISSPTGLLAEEIETRQGPRVIFVALRDIKSGEELFFKYKGD
jgi:SET domain-containing protein